MRQQAISLKAPIRGLWVLWVYRQLSLRWRPSPNRTRSGSRGTQIWLALARAASAFSVWLGYVELPHPVAPDAENDGTRRTI